jgi:HK97 family phage prohead protease
MKEIRYTVSEFELRGLFGEGARLEGYAAIFGAETVIGGLFREKVGPKAFTKTIKEADIRALFNHDANLVLGRNRAGTLRLATDDKGLRYEVDLPDTQTARDLWTSIDRGDITQSSFAFEVVQQRREEAKDDLPLRVLQEVRLFDISPVTFPAYELTEVQARSLMDTFEDRGATEGPEEGPRQEPEPSAPLEAHPDATQQPAPRGKSIYIAELAILERQ